MTPTYEDLQEQVRDLRERLDGVIGTIDYRTRLRHAFGLSPKQADVLAILINASRPVTTDNLYANAFEYVNGDGPHLAIVKVVLSQVRRRLRAFNAPGAISNAYGTGAYQLTADLRAWVAERVPA